jgi:hypothetical protein
MKCQLKVRNEIHNCEIKDRPSMTFKEEKQSDGSWVLKKEGSKWNPVRIKFTDRTFFGIYGSFDADLIVEGEDAVEIWTLKNAECDSKSLNFESAIYNRKKIKKG